MIAQPIDIPTLAEDLAGVDGLYPRDGRVALALYRLLAEGEPVSVERLAARTDRSPGEVADSLRGARAEEVAFHGLSLRPTRLRLEVDGRTLYAWCAGDVFLIHDLLGRPVQARSTDPREDSGRSFTERVDGTFLLTIEQGLELARLINRAVVGSALAR